MNPSRLLGMMVILLVFGVPRPGISQGTKQAPRASLPRPPKTASVRELPENIEEDLEGGLSLDAAMKRLIAVNRDLATKYQDIPKARADILSASQIQNPSVFLDTEGIPYGNYSPRRPGETEYAPTFVQPFDVSGKRRGRIRVAERAEKVLEALYQDAIRKKLDELGSAYVDVLEARLTVRAAQRAVAWLTKMRDTPRAERERRGPSDAVEPSLRSTQAQIALEQAEANLLEAQRRLALLLAVPSEHAADLVPSGSLRDDYPPPPGTEELIDAAVRARPDLAAYRLSVERAAADVQLTQAERFEDVLGFYTPYQVTTFPSQGLKTASGWEIGSLVVVPVFDRKQGELARSLVNVTQLQIQTQSLERAVGDEVRRAALEYAASRQVVQRYEKEIVPAARLLRDDASRRFVEGNPGLDSLLSAEKDYQETVGRYVDALVRHRRAMLHLNSAVGQRILP